MKNTIHKIERALFDLRRNQPVALQMKDWLYLILSVDGLTQQIFEKLKADCKLSLILTANRAKALYPKEDIADAVKLPVNEIGDIATLYQLAGLTGEYKATIKFSTANSIEKQTIQLIKLAKLLPAAIVADINETLISKYDMLVVSNEDINSYESLIANELKIVCTAPLKLKGAENAAITVFRAYPSSEEHYAIIIGNPDKNDAPLVRIHSSCFTGDLLASLRCDCGDQLKGAINFMGQHGSGVLLYLMQEGRGIGLVNKLRTYALQAEGFDTVDANKFLGFDDDERPYLLAANILKKIGFTKIRLMTNNPRKINGLEEQGIKVIERVAHKIEPHEHNTDYLGTKFSKLGHIS